MTESYPNRGPESGPNEPKKSGENAGSSKKESSPARPRIEQAGGEHRRFSPETKLRTPPMNELAGMALQEQREQFDAARRAHEAARREEGKSTEDKEAKPSVAGTESADTPAIPDQQKEKPRSEHDHTEPKPVDERAALPGPEVTGQVSAEKSEHDKFAETMRDMPELAAAASGDTLKSLDEKAEPSKLGPAAEQVPEHAPAAEAAFREIVGHPEVAELAEKQLPEVSVDEQAEPEAFEQWLQEHPELQSAELTAATSTDEAFNDIVQNSLGEAAPGDTRYHEQEPGEPPIDAGDGSEIAQSQQPVVNAIPGSSHNGAPGLNPNAQNTPNPNQPPLNAGNGGGGNRPPNPPTANGGYNGPPHNPNFGGGYNPNPNVLNNPWAPAGGLTDPAVWTAIGALEAQQQLNSLRHSSREAGLAGAVGILGLGLVLEHIFAKRRDKKQQRQINKQGKMIQETNRTLEQERYSHMRVQEQSGRQIETLQTSQSRTSEELRRIQEQRVKQEGVKSPLAGIPRAEVALGGGLISAAAATELGAKVGDAAAKEKQAAAKLEEQELQQRLATDPEFARTFRQNQASQMAAELAGAAPVTEAMRELRRERLQDKTADVGIGSVSAQTPGSVGGSSLPVSDGQGRPMTTAQYAAQAAKASAKQQAMARLNKPWTWAIVGFALVAVLAIVLGG
jgi:hypothetical protein